MNLDALISGIQPADRDAAARCIDRFDTVAKPVGSLGQLETLLSRIAAITGSEYIGFARKAVVVYCADNGVVKHGVAQGGTDITTAVAGMLHEGRASVSVMARSAGADVFPIDIGMHDTIEGMRALKLMRGTDDMTAGPAMTIATARAAIEAGADMVRELKALGYTLIASGEAGIGNTTTSAAVCAALLGRDAREVTGRGAGLDDDGLRRKRAAVDKALAVNMPDASDALDVLHKVGGLDIAAMTGLFLGGAYYRVPIVMDGFISCAAALCAARMCPDARYYFIPSHESGEPGARFIMEELGFLPILRAGMRLGEGTGAVALFPLLDMALAVYNDAARFADINVDQYKRHR